MHAFRVHCNVVIARASFFLFDESRSLKIHLLLHIPPNGIINPPLYSSTHDALTVEAARPVLVSWTSPRHIGKPRTSCAVAFLLSRRAILPRPCMTPLILDRYNLVSCLGQHRAWQREHDHINPLHTTYFPVQYEATPIQPS